jgi:hypothetical protein
MELQRAFTSSLSENRQLSTPLLRRRVRRFRTKPTRQSVANKLNDIWEKKPADEDYVAAHAYLSLLFSEAVTRKIVRDLRRAPTVRRQGKDLLRASQTHLLDKDDPHVAADLKKIKKGTKLSPVLLVRGDGGHGVTLTIADGQHRICASWHRDEDAPVACCIAALRGQ